MLIKLKTTLLLSLFLLIFITACSESPLFSITENTTSGDTVPGDTVPEDTVPEDTVPEDTIPAGTTLGNQEPGDYDLSLYFFHSNTKSTGGEITFTENYYRKPTGDELIFSRVIKYLNSGSIIEKKRPNNDDFGYFSISNNSINEMGIGSIGSQNFFRFIKVGDQYIDALIGDLDKRDRRDTCTLQDHLNDFDLSDAAGLVTIASGVYEDVLHVFCNRILTSTVDGTESNYSWNGYYAKNVGLIFANGNQVILETDNTWFVVGDAYLIVEY